MQLPFLYKQYTCGEFDVYLGATSRSTKLILFRLSRKKNRSLHLSTYGSLSLILISNRYRLTFFISTLTESFSSRQRLLLRTEKKEGFFLLYSFFFLHIRIRIGFSFRLMFRLRRSPVVCFCLIRLYTYAGSRRRKSRLIFSIRFDIYVCLLL